MCVFIAKFSKLTNKIPTTAKPTIENLKCFFISTQLSEVSFLLRRTDLTIPEDAQSLAKEIEDDLILTWR